MSLLRRKIEVVRRRARRRLIRRTLVLFGLLCLSAVGSFVIFGGYIGPEAYADEPGQLYTCGMHPNVIQEEPGKCPICGMDLVPMKNTLASSSTQVSGTTESSAGGSGHEGGEASGKRRIKYWVAPMDPTYISDKPGKSPMGMDLVPVYEDEAESAGGGIRIDPLTVQNMGVRVDKARRGEIWRNIRTVGQVDAAEDRVHVVNLRFSGWIERIYVDETGQRVKKGEPLFEIYSPEVIAAQEEYVLALQSAGADSVLARSARRRLQLLGIPKRQIEKLAHKRDGQLNVVIPAPASGFVLHKNVDLGARVRAGEDLYRIGDLDRVWIEAEVYEFDAPYVREGQSATIELPYEGNRMRTTEVDYVYPTLDPKTRTLRVRFELNNPQWRLRPGMFATVRLKAEPHSGIFVPSEAVLFTGERTVVFVSSALGHYEAREVKIGLVGEEDRTEILEGIREGEQVVVSGQFLLDSESQLQEAIQKMLKARLQRRSEANHD